MPQARRRTSRSRSSTSGRSQTRRSTGRSTRGKSTRSRSTASRSTRSTSRSRSTRARATSRTSDASVEAVAQRLRRLNERIIEAGKQAGETTLTNYEKALKTIASAIERGPGKSDVEWVSSLATAQAKFIRDVTSSWTSAARARLK
jgi:hypothetical protein